MQGPNEQDDPAMDQELKKGDIVYIPVEVVSIGNSQTPFDYIVATKTAYALYVKQDEIESFPGEQWRELALQWQGLSTYALTHFGRHSEEYTTRKKELDQRTRNLLEALQQQKND